MSHGLLWKTEEMMDDENDENANDGFACAK